MNCVDYLLQDHVLRQNDFILGRKETLSYHQLIDGVMKLAGRLNREVGTGQKIVLLMPNSRLSVISYLAIMKSGNVVVPLNPDIEKESLQHIIAICDTRLAIITKQITAKLHPDIKLLINEEELEVILKSEATRDWKRTSTLPDALAQIIFTSGSTALPKGVMISHRNIRANTDSITDYLCLSEKDCVEVVLPFFYCYGLSLLHTHLKVGGRIVLNNTFIFISSLIDDLKKYKCTGFAGVPGHFQILLRKSEAFKKNDYPHLRYVTQAGGMLHTAFINEFCDAFQKTNFYVMYGQTEATARLSYLPPQFIKSKLGSLGKGIPGVELKVVNALGNTVRAGEVGEIIAKGDNVMSGYFNEPDETAETIKNGWLYTGDLATVDEDDFIFYVSRRREIIKVGGKRVSPKEIEEVIINVPGVVDCTIEAVKDDLLGEAVKATVVVNSINKHISAHELKELCALKLANYKIPQVIVFADKLNVNAAGKKIKS